MLINAEELSPNQMYHTMTQTLIPRPVAWVLTENEGGNYNLAPFSYFTPVSSNPPVVMISVGKKPDGSLKDTRRNILERKRFTLHIASAAMAEQVTQTSATLDQGVSEVELAGLELEEFCEGALPRIKGCTVAYDCELHDVKEMGNLPQALIFGLVKNVYLDDSVAQEESGRLQVDALAINPLSRLGGDQYWINGEITSVKRPK